MSRFKKGDTLRLNKEYDTLYPSLMGRSWIVSNTSDDFQDWRGGVYLEGATHDNDGAQDLPFPDQAFMLMGFNPFDRSEFQPISKEDAEYLKGTPVPLKIMIPVKIEESKFTDFQPGEWVTCVHYNNSGSLPGVVFERKYQVTDTTPYWDQTTIKLANMGDYNYPSKQFKRCEEPSPFERMFNLVRPRFSPKEFMEAARASGQSSLGIENDPESCEILDKMAKEQQAASAQFKKGDWVRCINAEGMETQLTYGATYQVDDSSTKLAGQIVVKLEGRGGAPFYATRFVAGESPYPIPTNVTDACLHKTGGCPYGCGCWCDICRARRDRDGDSSFPENPGPYNQGYPVEPKANEDAEFLVVPEEGIALSKSCGFTDLEHAIAYASKEETTCIIYTATHKVVPSKVTKIG